MKTSSAWSQERVHKWLLNCFSLKTSYDKIERSHRFLEEALELAQACECSKSEVYQLVDYVFNRPTGGLVQEVGGVLNTLAALCIANNIDMMVCGDIEMDRVCNPDTMIEIRAKQAAKPKHSPLPMTDALALPTQKDMAEAKAVITMALEPDVTEHERNDALEQFDVLSHHLSALFDALKQVTKERDEAREAVKTHRGKQNENIKRLVQ